MLVLDAQAASGRVQVVQGTLLKVGGGGGGGV